MPFPAHEQVPPPKTAGRRKGSTPDEMVARVVDVGQMMVDQGMTLIEIYRWNISENKKDPNHLTTWNYSYRQVHAMTRKAREMGTSLLANSYKEALLMTLREYYALKRKAMAAGDFRAAYACVREISKIRGTYLPDRAKVSPIELPADSKISPMEWADAESVPLDPEASETDFDGVGMS